MAVRSALDVVSAYAAAMTNNDVASMESLRAESFVLDFVHYDASADPPLSAEITRNFWPAWFAAFPESDYEITRTIATPDVVVTQWVFIGTHEQPLGPPVFDEPVSPTGRTIRFRGVSVYDVEGGLIQRETLYLDLATVMVELGVEP
jgi:steroid delta-isomerase-like uncharacterized protein